MTHNVEILILLSEFLSVFSPDMFCWWLWIERS